MDSSISDADVTVNLDDSDWVPPANMSDDDSIEIVGEVCQRRTTRSRPVVATTNTHFAGEHSPSPRHAKRTKKQVFERGRYFGSQRGRGRSRGRSPHHHSSGERDPYQWAKDGYQSPAAARAAAASPSRAGTSIGSVTPERGEIATPSGQKRKLATDGEGIADGHAPYNKHFKEPTPVRKGKKRNSLSRVPKKSKRMTSLRSTHGPPLGGPIDSEKLKKIDTNASIYEAVESYMLSPTTRHNHGSWVPNPKNLEDSDLFELDLPDIDGPPIGTHTNNFNNLLSHNRKVSLVQNKDIKSTVDIGGKAVENFSINTTMGNISHSIIKSDKSTTAIEIISPTTSKPFALTNKNVKTEGRINHRIARLFGEDSVTSHTQTTPLTEKQAPVRSRLSRPPAVVSSSNCATPPSVIGRGRPDILRNTRSPLVPQVSPQTPLLLDSSIRRVKSEQTDLDLTSSSFEFSPARPSIKKRLSMLKKVTKRASLIGSGRKMKSPAVARSRALVAAALKSKSVVKRTTKAIDPDLDAMFEWDAARVISERQGVSESQARQVICLFEQECTLPFIARYRRENTGNMEIEKLREVQNAFEQLKEVKLKVAKVIKEDQKKNELSPDTKASLLNATSVQEVKALTASLKVSKGKRTFADRARQLGLAEAADALLNDHTSAQSQRWAMDLVMPSQDGRSNLEEVETGMKYIVADVISKDPKMLAYMKAGLKQSSIPFTSSKARKIISQEKASAKPKKVIAKRTSMGGKKLAPKKCDAGSNVSQSVVAKYEKYFDFSMPAWRIAPHVVCAINRGEQQGVLTVKVTMLPFVYTQFMRYCNDRWLGSLSQGNDGSFSAPYRRKLLLDALPDCYDRLVSPSLQSWIRSELSDAAELASIEVFATNLRSLLLTPPVKINTVIAIDPGFSHGCKLAVVERKGKVLAVDTIFPFGGRHQVDEAVGKFRQLVVEYRCEVVCIGNGTACRQTETWLSELINGGVFGNVNVQYTIIDESGASHYSITPEAKEEFPDLDINHISAVSLARRLQDPLLEYVKVPPMHLGVGMYQHDVSSKLLKTSLDSVVMECVSFVGVDLNVASELVLKKVSGLNKARAAAIVKHREDCGAFRSREELKKVKGIGPISFQQCAGFVRIVPQTLRQRSSNSSLASLCPLDSTTVHPESYDSAKKLMALAGVDMKDIGTAAFATALRTAVHKFPSPKELSVKVGCSEPTLHVILESLYQPLEFDFRGQFDQPLFRKGVTKLEDLRQGEHMTGSVRNVTPFGAFIDIGVGNNGLLHNRYMNGQVLQLGNTVTVEILNIEAAKGRIGLKLVQVMG